MSEQVTVVVDPNTGAAVTVTANEGSVAVTTEDPIGLPVGGADGQVLTKQSAADYDAAWEDPTGGAGGGAPTTVDYLVGTANASLSAEIVVGTTPGGELGGTWASPTVDTTHSGSSHADAAAVGQAAAEATAAAALAAHEADTTSIHGIADTSALETTAGAQAKVDAHVNDATDAHDASAISILDAAADFTATDVEGALAELQADAEADATALSDHLADATAAHAASAISYAGSATLAATDVEAALDELDSEKAATASAVMDGDAAGGVLAGTYPNPSFASDMATQAELDAHTTDATDAHDASAISIADSGGDFTATDVEGALAELQADAEADATDLANHLADATDAHDASAISVADAAGNFTGTDVETVLDELFDSIGGGGYTDEQAQDAVGTILTDSSTIDFTYDDVTPGITASVKASSIGTGELSFDVATQAELDAHTGDSTAAHAASAISIADAAGDFTATDVEGALAELQSDAEADATALSDHLADAADAHDASAISVLDTAANFTGTDVEAVLAELHDAIGGGGYTDEQAQDAVGLMVADTSTIDLTYTDATPELKADVINDSITNAKLANVATATIKGRATAAAGDPEDLTASQVRTILDVPTNAEAVLDTLVDAKGDLLTATAADTPARLAVGSNDQILMADSAQSTGLKWVSAATPSTQALGDSASAGTADTFTRGDHKHAMPSAADIYAGAQSINAQTGTTYTLVIGDAGKLVTLSNASAITLTVPPNSSVAFATGTRIDLAQIGAGQVTVAQGAGVTVNATPGLKCRAQYSGATLIKTGTDTWLLVGDLSA